MESSATSVPSAKGPSGVSLVHDMGLTSRFLAAALVIAVFFGGFGLWAGLAPLQSGAIASGSVKVAGQRKTLQHLEGGIVEDLLVKEGDQVEAGQVLIRLSENQILAQIQLLWGQLAASLAETSRLTAEQSKVDQITFDPEILKLLGNNEDKYNEVTEGQRAIFASRRDSFDSQKQLTQQRVRQLQAEITGLQSEIKSQEVQLKIINEEIKDLSGLLEKGFARKPRVLELQRQSAALTGERDQNRSRIARARQAIVEAELGLVEAQTELTNEVVTQLRDTRQQIADLREKVTATEDVLSRVEVRSPVAGRVVNLQIFTQGGVISPGAPIMDIVPQDELLVVEARVEPIDIDSVHAGLQAEIRLPAFRADELPVLSGIVENVFPDSLVDQNTGQTYYSARIVLAKGVSLPEDKVLQPGMPAEVLIVTGQRTALSYLVEPITRSLGRSLREN